MWSGALPQTSGKLELTMSWIEVDKQATFSMIQGVIRERSMPAQRSRSEARSDLKLYGLIFSPRLLNLDVRHSVEMFREPQC